MFRSVPISYKNSKSRDSRCMLVIFISYFTSSFPSVFSWIFSMKSSSSGLSRSLTDPSATRRPWWMIANRSQIDSTSERMWVLKNTVVPCFLSSRMRSLTILRPIGSSPLIGSSRKTIFGSLMMDCASPIRWSIPFEYFARILSPA